MITDMRRDVLNLAHQQYGLLSVEQAKRLGYLDSALRRSWERFLPAVYRRPEFPASWYQQAKGLTLWGGGETALSHVAAAALLKLKGFSPGEIHVVSVRQGRHLPDWAHVHRVAQVPSGTGHVRGIRVVPPWITMLEVCAVVPKTTASKALDDALRRRLVTLRQMGWVLATYGGAGHGGSSVLRELLEERSAPGTRYVPPESELEDLLYKLVASAAGLPRAERQYWVWDGTQWRRFDLAWPEVGLAVEVDGWETHGTREAFQDDRERDALMVAIGWRVLRFTWDDVVKRPSYVLDVIGRALSQNTQK
jgi:hypothetical protein